MESRWIVGTGAACLAAGYMLGQSVGPAPVSFPDPSEARSAEEMEVAVNAALLEPRAFVRAGTLSRLFEGLTLEGPPAAWPPLPPIGFPIPACLRATPPCRVGW